MSYSIKNILIIGGSYFVGKHLLQSLIKLNYNIVIFNRGTQKHNYCCEHIKGNRNNIKELELAFYNKKYDLVIDTCCYFIEQMNILLNYIDHFQSLIYISSGLVYSNFTKECKESDIIGNYFINKYAYNKRSIEQILIKSKANYLILRPSLLFGEYEYQKFSTIYIEQIKRNGYIYLPCPFEKLGMIQPLYVKYLVDVIIYFCKTKFKCEIFNVGGTYIPVSTYIQMIYKTVGVSFKKEKLIYDPKYIKLAMLTYTLPYNNSIKISSLKLYKKIGIDYENVNYLLNGLDNVAKSLKI